MSNQTDDIFQEVSRFLPKGVSPVVILGGCCVGAGPGMAGPFKLIVGQANEHTQVFLLDLEESPERELLCTEPGTDWRVGVGAVAGLWDMGLDGFGRVSGVHGVQRELYQLAMSSPENKQRAAGLLSCSDADLQSLWKSAESFHDEEWWAKLFRVYEEEGLEPFEGLGAYCAACRYVGPVTLEDVIDAIICEMRDLEKAHAAALEFDRKRLEPLQDEIDALIDHYHSIIAVRCRNFNGAGGIGQGMCKAAMRAQAGALRVYVERYAVAAEKLPTGVHWFPFRGMEYKRNPDGHLVEVDLDELRKASVEQEP